MTKNDLKKWIADAHVDYRSKDEDRWSMTFFSHNSQNYKSVIQKGESAKKF